MTDNEFVKMAHLLPGTHWEGNRMIDDAGGLYNAFCLQRCDINDIPAKIYDDRWEMCPGAYLTRDAAYDARIRKMHDDPDHYYMIIWLNMPSYGKIV